MLFASNKSNLETGHVHLPSNSRSVFWYQGMVQRTQTILAYLYDKFPDDFNLLHISDEYTYLIV